ncbi:EamA family transporter RarD [Prosthecobacter vanneervenii]|uniref:Chloramphenicol-sensitive protein RarD n=1 Tax=Prosthecobacter vanneervenii TaxID=48466 RepID=A0A7W8DME0_9BACT|nr:EamA family transporter RarD [Prosthecobacter vanneervenii]MBB5035132.1 chloramphenicol-sensitive protein RarD [Prosthecobacter vanneervenii]
MNSEKTSANAALSAVLAFGLWGVLPVYWKQLGHLGSDVALAQRVVWTLATVMPLLMLRGEWSGFLRSLRNARLLGAHAWSAFLLAINWGVFVWAAQHGRIIDCSLGYFINPLLNVLIGSRLLGERLTGLQKLSIFSAACGVLTQLVLVGRFPWIGLLLAGSFALYGLARRRSPLGSLPGLAMETVVGVPVALVYLIWAQQSSLPIWGTASAHDLLLIIGLGIITTIPLLGFAHGARQLPFALLGVLQFLAPTGQFLVGALLYHEPVGTGTLLSFGLIWLGVLQFCGDLWLRKPGKA